MFGRSRARLPVVLCIDVEPEERYVDRASRRWESFRRSFGMYQTWRERLADATRTQAHLSWFLRMDPQVASTFGSPDAVVVRDGDLIARLVAEGDEIGLHVHMFRWDEDAGHWLTDHGDPEWVGHCIDTSLRAFERSFGRRCRSFRFGDGWCSNEGLARTESAGVRYDLTAEPESRARPSLVPSEPHTGCLPGWDGTPRRPYRPSRRDFRVEDASCPRGTWMIPVSVVEEKPGGGERRGSFRTLNLTLESDLFAAGVEAALARPRPLLVCMARADDIYRPVAGDFVHRNLEYLAAHDARARLAFSRPDEALRRLGLESRFRQWRRDRW